MSAGASTLSRFTPSLMSHELLERLFVARDSTLDAILARVEAAAGSTERNHTLLVGPRGAGKTHLVALAYHRINRRRGAGAALQVAWLPEDPWTIVSYRHLLKRIAERLEPALEDGVPDSEGDLESLLSAQAASGGPIVVLIENLDQVLNALGNPGQQRLRHLLQAERSLLLIATSTRLDRTLSDQASPFYAFFTTTRLEPFDVGQAAAMLKAIAEDRGDQDDLVRYLDSDQGRRRLRTIAHLAGGQPRMWAALASALTVGGLGELVDLLLTRFDDLTPYYQEQLARLSPQERLVVAELAELDRPVNVRELADRLDIDQRSLGKTISELADRGWASPTTSPVTALLDRRRTYYELEPLARLAFQIKESRGEPLRLVIEFLKHWFDPADLGEIDAQGALAEYVLLAGEGHERDPVTAVTRRLHRLPLTRAPAVALLAEADAALAALAAGDGEPFIRLPTPVRAALEEELDSRDPLDVRQEIHRAAAAEFGRTRHPAMAAWIERAEEMVVVPGPVVSARQLLLADWLARAWRFGEATEVLAAAALGEEDHPQTLASRNNLAHAYESAGRLDEATPLFERTLADSARVLGKDHPDTLASRNNLAHAYRSAGRLAEATPLFERTLADSERVLGKDHPQTLVTRNNLAHAYQSAGRLDEATPILERTLADSECVLGKDHPQTLVTRNNLAHAYRSAGRLDEATPILERTLADSERVLGKDHPQTLSSRNNLAGAYLSGRLDEATPLFERTLADRERVLGDDHPDTLSSRNNLAQAYWSAGRLDEATPLFERTLADRERVLGEDHPDTLASRNYLAHAYESAVSARAAGHPDR